MSKPTNRRRSPGRPTTGDAADLRERLLDAAIARFVSDGIAATSLRGVAEDVGVTPALLNYYFGGRDALIQAVVQERLMPVFGGIRERIAEAGDDPSALISGFVSAIWAAIEKYPWIPSLWMREVLLEGGALRDAIINSGAAIVPRTIVNRFEQAQASGRLRKDLDPRLMMLSLVAMTLFPAAAAPVWRQLLNADDIDTAALQRHALLLLEQGLHMEPTS